VTDGEELKTEKGGEEKGGFVIAREKGRGHVGGVTCKKKIRNRTPTANREDRLTEKSDLETMLLQRTGGAKRWKKTAPEGTLLGGSQ